MPTSRLIETFIRIQENYPSINHDVSDCFRN